jgi:hypothetical protein
MLPPSPKLFIFVAVEAGRVDAVVGAPKLNISSRPPATEF